MRPEKAAKAYRIYRKILRVVSDLHVRGFQRIRIAPGVSASGMIWRCAITPASNISSEHGARIVSWDNLAAHYASSSEEKYFGWTDVVRATPGMLAELFIARFPMIVEAGRGSDWLYAGWYLEMLHLTYPDAFPIAYADWELPRDHLTTMGGRSDVRIPLPPPGTGRAISKAN